MTNGDTDFEIGYLAPNAFVGGCEHEDECFGHPS